MVAMSEGIEQPQRSIDLVNARIEQFYDAYKNRKDTTSLVDSDFVGSFSIQSKLVLTNYLANPNLLLSDFLYLHVLLFLKLFASTKEEQSETMAYIDDQLKEQRLSGEAGLFPLELLESAKEMFVNAAKLLPGPVKEEHEGMMLRGYVELLDAEIKRRTSG